MKQNETKKKTQPKTERKKTRKISSCGLNNVYMFKFIPH